MMATLTDYERQLVTDSKILLAKNRIIQLVTDFFGDISAQYQKTFENYSNPATALVNAKISRGENYLGLPYVMLDFPRQFSKENVFAIRSFFWWGNFFSITLHLSGQYQQKYFSDIEKAIKKGLLNDWYIAHSENQWHHHFYSDNYVLIEQDKNYNIRNLSFLKIAKKISLVQWDEAEVFFIRNFKLLLEIAAN